MIRLLWCPSCSPEVEPLRCEWLHDFTLAPFSGQTVQDRQSHPSVILRTVFSLFVMLMSAVSLDPHVGSRCGSLQISDSRILADVLTDSVVNFPIFSLLRVLFSSSVLNLCELVALRPDLTPLKKVLYFHENQLVYPVRKDQERDFQYGYNQVLSW